MSDWRSASERSRWRSQAVHGMRDFARKLGRKDWRDLRPISMSQFKREAQQARSAERPSYLERKAAQGYKGYGARMRYGLDDAPVKWTSPREKA